MYLTISVLLLLILAIIVITIIIAYNKFEEMSLRIAEADRLLMELKNNKKLDEIIKTMSIMANGYVRLKDNYNEMGKRNSDILAAINEIQERYCDSYEQFEYCNNELIEIKALFREAFLSDIEDEKDVKDKTDDTFKNIIFTINPLEIQNGSETDY